jgi:hypothetical protein
MVWLEAHAAGRMVTVRRPSTITVLTVRSSEKGPWGGPPVPRCPGWTASGVPRVPTTEGLAAAAGSVADLLGHLSSGSRLDEEVRAAVLRPARLSPLGAERAFLSVADDRDPRAIDTV